MKRILLFTTTIAFLFISLSADAQRRRDDYHRGGDHYRYEHGHGRKKDKHYKKHYNKPHRIDRRHAYYDRSHHRSPYWSRAHRYRMNRHVYFPDYYTFYDAQRAGYVYWHNNAWLFSPTVPSFMANVDLGAARIQLMGDLPLSSRPEMYWGRYHRSYPARGSININIPLPR